jgi:AcrR family transcriptional regulator
MARRATAKAERPYHHGDLRNALVTKALELIEQKGPDAISLRELARQVGVNHRAAYRHFEDKRALTAAIAEAGYLALVEALEACWEETKSKAPRARVEAMMDRYLELAFEAPARYRITFGRRVNEDNRFPTLEALAQRAYSVLMQALGALRKATEPELLNAVFALWSMAHGYLRLVWARRIRVRPELRVKYFRALAAPFLDGWSAGR